MSKFQLKKSLPQGLSKIALIFAVLCVSACVSYYAKTPAQKLYAAVADYTRLQDGAITYKNKCQADVFTVDQNCEKYVEEFVKINKKVTALVNTLTITPACTDEELAVYDNTEKCTGANVEYAETVTTSLLMLSSELAELLAKAQQPAPPVN